MSIFNYQLPSGSTFRLTAPSGTTQLQADLIFYSQVAAGALVGYSPGQTLTSRATAVTKFGLSRQDRGTAGVDTQPVLSLHGLAGLTNTNARQTFNTNGQPVSINGQTINILKRDVNH